MPGEEQKIELRSTTGHPYRRAGALWPTQWTELDKSAFTAEQIEALAKDPHLEARVGGKRAGSDGEPSGADPEAARKLAELTSAVEALGARNAKLEDEVASLAKQLAEAIGAKAAAEAKLAEAEAKVAESAKSGKAKG
jgi:hypothetical protein